MLITSLVSPFALMIAWTVTPKRVAIAPKVSPDWTT